MVNRFLPISLIVLFLGVGVGVALGAESPSPNATYTLMQPIGPLTGAVDLTTYLTTLYQILIGVTGVLAVVRIVICGIKIMSTASPSAKNEAKSCIGEALLGLLIALFSYAILNTISPQLTSATLDLSDVNITQTEVSKFSGAGNAPGGGTGTGGGSGSGSDGGSSGGSSSGSATGALSTQGVSCSNTSTAVNCGGCSLAHQCSSGKLSGATLAPGVTQDIVLSIMQAESTCGSQLVSPAGAYGIMQMLPSTANLYRHSCGVEQMVGKAWMIDPKNDKENICIASYYIKSLFSACGNDVRNILAAYNGGPGVCRARSRDCAEEKGCDGQVGSMRTWQCPYDDKNHRTCNKGYSETRNYVRKQCD